MKIMHNNLASPHKVTLIGCVHGSESYGRVVFEYFAKNLSLYPGLTLILANEEALSKRMRYIDADLNRSFPGKQGGNLEERLAHQLLKVINPDSFIIDIHTTRGDVALTPIITNQTSRTRILLNQLPNTKIVYMKSGFRSLISQFRGSVSLEYADLSARKPENLAHLETMVRNLLLGEKCSPRLHQVYVATGKIPLDMRMPTKAKSFELIEGTNIIPFLPRRVAFRGTKGFCLSGPKAITA